MDLLSDGLAVRHSGGSHLFMGLYPRVKHYTSFSLGFLVPNKNCFQIPCAVPSSQQEKLEKLETHVLTIHRRTGDRALQERKDWERLQGDLPRPVGPDTMRWLNAPECKSS